jgi:hypothetical protein
MREAPQTALLARKGRLKFPHPPKEADRAAFGKNRRQGLENSSAEGGTPTGTVRRPVISST